jgi:SAM-dependent methyltransferase
VVAVTAVQREKLAELAEAGEVWAAAAGEFGERHQTRIDGYRQEISAGMGDALRSLRDDVRAISGGNTLAVRVGEETAEYADWMQWSLWDLPAFAVAIEPEPAVFRRAVTACGLVYTAIRVFDDLIDRHYSYKGRRRTLLAVSEEHARPGEALALNSLAGLLLCFDGLDRLSDSDDPALADTRRLLVASIRRAVVGAIMEFTDLHEWSIEDYRRLVRLKNVDYWRALYAAVDPRLESPLYPFLERYYELAQYLNDVGDYAADLASGQPNLVALRAALLDGEPACHPLDGASGDPAGRAVEDFLADHYLELGRVAAGLPAVERGVAELKLHESLTRARGLGLLDPSRSAAGAPGHAGPDGAVPARRPDGPRLFWYSEAEDVVEHAGPEALVDVCCGVCGSPRRQPLFHKQGFGYHRCADCGHVYVSPRISVAVQAGMLLDLDDLACEDSYLEVQRVYAETICQQLRDRTPGARLLDIGFGRGYLLQMAQVYGFEVYGLDGSHAQVAELRPQFGDRVAHGVLGRDEVPWDGLDVVVMSHILEHVADPAAVLAHVRERMTPGGWVYLAVPDLGSLHFTIFGKRWDAVNPLAHLQYFTEDSLRHLLAACSFERIERIRHPPVDDAVAPRWMRLMRQLGGSESSELLMLARATGGNDG